MLQDLLVPIDIYCERIDASFWSEPVNAATNLVIVAAGLVGVWAVRRERAGAFAEAIAWWIVVIGVGSALFHTFANRLTVLADVLPIAIFTLALTLFALRRMFGFAWPKAIGIFVGFYAVAGLLTYMVPDWLRDATNGTTGYLPAFLALGIFGVLLAARGHPAGRYFVAGLAIFVVSVVFRSVDEGICPSFPLGTHFLWHTLNGIMLGVLILGVARHGRPRTA